MKISNPVPPETIVRHQAREIGKLQAEIDHLEYELEQKNAAIAAFKKWQKKIIEYKLAYWFGEALKLLDTPPEDKSFIKLCHRVYRIIEAHKVLSEWERKVDKAFKNVVESHKQAEKVRDQIEAFVNNPSIIQKTDEDGEDNGEHTEG